jgi:hypothetical protein
MGIIFLSKVKRRQQVCILLPEFLLPTAVILPQTPAEFTLLWVLSSGLCGATGLKARE